MRKRRGKHARGNVSQATTSLTVVMCLAVMTGFLGVKYVISPWMNGAEAQTSGSVTGEKQSGEAIGAPQSGDAAAQTGDTTSQSDTETGEPETKSGASAQQTPQGQPSENAQQSPQSQQSAEETPDSQQPQKNQQSSGTNPVVEDQVETVATKAFAVQLGSFSTEEAAKQRASELSAQGIPASVQLRDGAWKVVSSGYSTKEEARTAAAGWREIAGDAFVVAI